MALYTALATGVVHMIFRHLSLRGLFSLVFFLRLGLLCSALLGCLSSPFRPLGRLGTS